jgi:SagB-type dehydrogenase family enzyme
MKKALIGSMFVVMMAGLVNAQEISAIKLDAPQLTKGKLLMQAMSNRRSTRDYSAKELSLHELSDVLWCANGINRKESGMRTVPTAMNKQEIDVYAVMKSGVYMYDAKNNSLVPVASGDHRKAAGLQDFVATAPLNLVYVADFSKMESRIDETARKMYAAMDAGHCSQSVYLYCASAGLGTVVRGYFDEKELEKALKLRSGQKIILAQTVGHLK